MCLRNNLRQTNGNISHFPKILHDPLILNSKNTWNAQNDPKTNPNNFESSTVIDSDLDRLYCSEFGLRDLTWCNGACAWRLTTATIALPLLSPEMMALPRQRWTMNPEVRETVVRMMKMSFPSEQRRWRGSDSGHCSPSLRGRFWPSQSSICLLCSHWVLRNKP